METKNTKRHYTKAQQIGMALHASMEQRYKNTKPLFETLEECEVCAKAGGRCHSCFSDAPEIATQALS